MLYHLLYPLKTVFGGFNVFRYITFRTIFAILTALIISLAVGSWFIRKLKEMQISQTVREEGPKSHYSKNGTPTMGGLMIILATVTATLLWAELNNPYVWLLVLVTLGFGFIGFYDDYLKVVKKHNQGLSGRAQAAGPDPGGPGAGPVALYVSRTYITTLTVPFFKQVQPDLGWFFISVRGLCHRGQRQRGQSHRRPGRPGHRPGDHRRGLLHDLLLTWPVTSRSPRISKFLMSGEWAKLSIYLGALVGAGVGFLWFNAYPAQVFMGDVGALALGGVLGTVALATKQEILLAIVGGLFVVEALSRDPAGGLFQGHQRHAASSAWRRMHHHFELKGWPEPKVIVRFWIIAIVLGDLCP